MPRVRWEIAKKEIESSNYWRRHGRYLKEAKP